MKIKWNNYIDQIYSLSYPGNQEQMEKHRNEICRVDILDSGIYYNYINIRTPFYKYIFNSMPKYYDHICYNNGFFITMGHYHIIKQAYEMGYEYIAIMEYDINFLKDKNQIIKILNAINEAKKLGFDVCCCQLENLSVNDMFDFDNDNFFSYKPNIEQLDHYHGGAGFNIYSRNGMEKLIHILEEEYCTIDNYTLMIKNNNLKVVSIFPWICIQDKYDYIFPKDNIKNLYNLKPLTDIELANEFIKMLLPVGTNYKGEIIVYNISGGYDNLIKKILDKFSNKNSIEYYIMNCVYETYNDKNKAIEMFNKISENQINYSENIKNLYNFAKKYYFL